MSQSEGLKVVETAVDLLIYLSRNNSGIGPREISRLFDISTTAAQRLVTSLERKGCLMFDPVSKKYKLGYGLIRLVHGSMGQFNLVTVAREYMEKLRDSTGETICLNVMIEHKRMTVFQVESRNELRWIAEVGKLYPLYIGASGKAILANQDESLITHIIREQLPELTPKEEAALRLDLEKIRKSNVALTFGERISGGIGIAVPIRLRNDVASLSIYAPSSRMDEEKIADCIARLKEAVGKIESEFSVFQ